MSIVAHTRPFVIGVDTHARKHCYAILTAVTGALIATNEFPTTPSGMKRALSWVARLTGGDLAALWVIECAANIRGRAGTNSDRRRVRRRRGCPHGCTSPPQSR